MGMMVIEAIIMIYAAGAVLVVLAGACMPQMKTWRCLGFTSERTSYISISDIALPLQQQGKILPAG